MKKEGGTGGVEGGEDGEKEDIKLGHEVREMVGKMGWGGYDHISLYTHVKFSKSSRNSNKEVTFRINAKIQ